MEPREGTLVEGQGLMPSLVGVALPSIELPATRGIYLNPAKRQGRCILFFYPYTGAPNHADPPGWDDIPGAHGSTPQALAFSNAYFEFEKFDVKVFGVSFQSTAWQKDFVVRNNLRIELLSDSARKLSSLLNLETFRAGESAYLVRRTIVVNEGVISHDFYPVPVPENNAADVLKALKS